MTTNWSMSHTFVVKETVEKSPNSKLMMLSNVQYVGTESSTKKESSIPNNQSNIKPYDQLIYNIK